MNKLFLPLLVLATLGLVGCSAVDDSPATSNDASSPQSSTPDAIEETEPVVEEPQAPDLSGEWKQINSASADDYQQATISGDTMSIDWVADAGATVSVYWVGTFQAPADASSPYAWTSLRDAAATDSALLASTADSKDFTFNDDIITYEVSALGTTMQVELQKQ